MKKIVFSLSALLTLALIFTSCEKEDSFDYDNYTPVILGGISGPAVGYASGLAPLTYSVTHRGGSTYNWSVSGIGASIEISEVNKNFAYITFDQSDNNVTATITVTETASGGKTSDPVSKVVELNKFSPLAIEGFYGTWSGTDAGYENTITVAADGATTLTVGNFSAPMIEDWWGEPIVAGGPFVMNVNLGNGGIEIPRQYIYTTTYDGDEYTYEIMGSGIWDNTGEVPILVISYDIYYPGDATGIGVEYKDGLFTANFTLN